VRPGLPMKRPGTWVGSWGSCPHDIRTGRKILNSIKKETKKKKKILYQFFWFYLSNI